MLAHISTQHTSSKSATWRAFTLVELLVVIGIISLLVSILLPSLAKAREAAVVVQCASQMRQLAMATMMYADSNKGTFPYTFAGYTGVGSGGSVSTPWFVTKTSTPISAPPTLYLDLLPEYGISSNSVRICPAARSNTVNLANGSMINVEGTTQYWNYRYNAVLGGTNYPSRTDPYFSYDVQGSVALARPLKYGQIKDSSNVAMYVESASMATWAACAAQMFRMELDSATGLQRSPIGDWDINHNVRYKSGTFWVPWAPNIRPQKEGTMNIAFADGSVRAYNLQWDQHPAKPWDEGRIKIDPRR